MRKAHLLGRSIAAFLLVFLGFALQGAWPVPDVNEPHYVGKMIAYWDRNWIANDPFLSSADAHPIFYAVFGWPSLLLNAETFTWLARGAGWALVAGGWFTFARQLLPGPAQIVLAGLLFGLLQERFNMAGEWVIGGIEAKVPAYGLVFFGLAALVRKRWNLAFVCFGAAAAFHVLAGGWALLAGILSWIVYRRGQLNLRESVPGLAAAVLLALPSALVALRLSWGVDSTTLEEAYQIYLFRLGHHLSLFRLPGGAVDRFILLIFCWYLLERINRPAAEDQSFRLFVMASLAIAALGCVLSFLELVNPKLAASLLRYYWFRLADVMLPAAVALAATRLTVQQPLSRSSQTRLAAVLLWGIAAVHVVYCGYSRLGARIPRADENQVEDYAAWKELCQWVATSGDVPRGSRFLTPRTSYTFRWYARRADIVNWKDIPQDAPSIVRWWHTLCKVHAYRDPAGRLRWLPNLAYGGTERLRKVASEVGADFVIAPVWPPLDLPIVFKNSTYAVYRITEPSDTP